jgi:hypothetical protein
MNGSLPSNPEQLLLVTGAAEAATGLVLTVAPLVELLLKPRRIAISGVPVSNAQQIESRAA